MADGAPFLSQEKLARLKESSRQRLKQNEHVPIGKSLTFSICAIPDLAIKDDMATMEAAVFTLATKRDLRVWRWSSSDGKKSIEVAPSAYGRATMHDKDLLIYIESHLVAAFNRGETPSRTVSFSGYHYLKVTGKNTWSDDYRRMKQTLDRLRGTTIKTNIKTGGREITTSFGLIDAWKMIEAGDEDERKVAICVTISEWLYNAIKASEILTLNPCYFGLRKPLERRMYEIARKHAGRQGLWEIGFETLRHKCGSTVERARQFRAEVNKIAAADNLPDYRVTVTATGKVRFISRDPAQVAKRLAKAK